MFFKDFNTTNGAVGNKDLVNSLGAGQFLMYENVELNVDMKSVAVKAKISTEGMCDGEILEFRLDSPIGKKIGYIVLDDTEGQEQVTRASIKVPKSGIYNLYIVSVIGRGNTNILQSFEFSNEEFKPIAYESVPKESLVDTYSDTWCAIDEAKRILPDNSIVGDRRNKQVGIFYWTWHEAGADTHEPQNNSEVMENAQNPYKARFDYNYEGWGKGTANFWNEPLFGYYRNSDKWVLRKHAIMLSDAGVDVVIFDCTNGPFSWKRAYMALLETFHEARLDGIKTPQIAFMLNFGPIPESRQMLKSLYYSIYKDGKYKDLFYIWKGKPLIMAYPQSLTWEEGDADDEALCKEITEFFTFREPQPSYTSGPQNNRQWGWLERVPLHRYVENEDGSSEQMIVGTSQNHSSRTDNICAMNADYAQGRSYTKAKGHDLTPGAYKYGWNFEEQWEEALKNDPEFIFITGWNEWTAGRYEDWCGNENAFPDQFDNECSRDIEPTKGDMKDNYYYQMVSYIRKFKGARPVKAATKQKTIKEAADWDNVENVYVNHKGIPARNSKGYKGTHYVNETLKNDIVKCIASHDEDNIYLCAQCTDAIKPSSEPNFMRLFIRGSAHNPFKWKGYHYMVQQGVLYSSNFAWNWSKICDIEYKIAGNKMWVKIPREKIGMKDGIDIEFKWADNMQSNDIMDFWQSGSVAPTGRFNYRYLV